MNWFTRMFRKKKTEEAKSICRHVNLVPRWDDPADIGKDDRATGYGCVACNGVFTLEEARAMGRAPVA